MNPHATHQHAQSDDALVVFGATDDLREHVVAAARRQLDRHGRGIPA